MTKSNLVDQVTQTTACAKKDVEQIVEAIFGQITTALSKGEKVDLRGFGSFQANRKNERQGRNPQTGATMTIAAKTVAVFKPSKELAERVNSTPSSEAQP